MSSFLALLLVTLPALAGTAKKPQTFRSLHFATAYGCESISAREEIVMQPETTVYSYEFRVECFADKTYAPRRSDDFLFRFETVGVENQRWEAVIKGFELSDEERKLAGSPTTDCLGPNINVATQTEAVQFYCVKKERAPLLMKRFQRFLDEVSVVAGAQREALARQADAQWKAHLKAHPRCVYYRSGQDTLIHSKGALGKPLPSLKCG